jgi:hypothetical protein
LKKKILFLLLAGAIATASAQSPYTNVKLATQSFTASSQTGAAIQLGQANQKNSYSLCTIAVTGASLTTATFAVQASVDGTNYFSLLITPTSSITGATTQTVTGAAAFTVPCGGWNYLQFVTSGTFTGTSITLILTASPNAQIGQTLPASLPPSGAASGDLGGSYPAPTVLSLAHVTNGAVPVVVTPPSVTTSALTVTATANVAAPTSSGATSGGTAGVSSTNFLYASCIDAAGNTTAASNVSANIATITANQTIPWVIVRPAGLPAAAVCYGWPATSGTPAHYFSFGTGTAFSQSLPAASYTAAASYPAGGAFPASNATGPISAGRYAGGGKLPLCVDNSGNIYAGTNTVGVLACP